MRSLNEHGVQLLGEARLDVIPVPAPAGRRFHVAYWVDLVVGPGAKSGRIGRATIIRISLAGPSSIESIDEELARYALPSAVWQRLRSVLRDVAQPVGGLPWGDALLVQRVALLQSWRGLGLGPLLLGLSLQALRATTDRFAATHPAPRRSSRARADTLVGRAALVGMVQDVGFRRFADTEVWVLDLGTDQLDRRLERLRERAGLSASPGERRLPGRFGKAHVG